MSRAYQWERKYRSYAVPVPPTLSVLGVVHRPTKTAAGLTYTRGRNGHRAPLTATDPHTLDMGRLAFRGTLDTLRGLGQRAAPDKTKCRCCGQPTRKLVLTISGRSRLTHLRQLRLRRLQLTAQAKETT